ncbi:undecaprenyl-diphosphate phosphatase [uncultured Caulobacter sp.]|uniref:undecaprenyl-diphosphate phosphatase n=1 Tax=uncultured Caulobacter sp. TaxID=158749 RepID=UPI00262BEA14|nr:undecaprenyl-diphosphate phosphatase [uncultured Caulobacter sp.]
MPDWLSAILLGLVEGLTEFIPVSSTGHLLLTKGLMGLKDASWDTFIVLIQLGAILAVVALYFQRLWGVLIGLPTRPEARRFALSVIIAVIPAFAAGLLLHDVIKKFLFESPLIICWSLLIGGVILLAIDRKAPPAVDHDAMALPLHKVLIVGLFQCLSLIPGVSRSGSTIVGSMLLGIERRAAAEFSFFMAIPIMVGAFALDVYKNRDALDTAHVGIVAIGFVVSFLSGLVVVKYMLDFVSKRGFAPFAWWRIAVGVAGLAVLYLRH